MRLFWTKYSWIVAGVIALTFWIWENNIGHQALQRTLAPGSVGQLVPEMKLEGESRKVDPQPTNIAALPSKKSNYPSEQTLKVLEDQLNISLSDRGFSPYDADVFFKILRSKLLDVDPSNALNAAKEEAIGSLQLNPERAKLLSEGLTAALEETGGAFTFQDWEDCLTKRIEKYKADSCDLEVLDSLKKIVASSTIDNRITTDRARMLQKASQEAAAESVEQCKREINSALEFFAVDVGHCD